MQNSFLLINNIWEYNGGIDAAILWGYHDIKCKFTYGKATMKEDHFPLGVSTSIWIFCCRSEFFPGFVSCIATSSWSCLMVYWPYLYWTVEYQSYFWQIGFYQTDLYEAPQYIYSFHKFWYIVEPGAKICQLPSWHPALEVPASKHGIISIWNTDPS